MNINEVKNKIIEIIMKALEGRIDIDTNINDKEDLVSALGINSIEAIEIIVRLENEFDIEVDDTELSVDFLRNIDYIANYIISKIH